MRQLLATLAVLAALATSAVPALAQNGSKADGAALQAVIDDQIAAFRRDDGSAAYSHAAPSIKQLFPSVQRFMEMVRKGYQPVYRPQSYYFGPVLQNRSGPVQSVRLIGPSGGEWIALYSFEQQPDGSWKITGVVLRKAEGESA